MEVTRNVLLKHQPNSKQLIVYTDCVPFGVKGAVSECRLGSFGYSQTCMKNTRKCDIFLFHVLILSMSATWRLNIEVLAHIMFPEDIPFRS